MKFEDLNLRKKHHKLNCSCCLLSSSPSRIIKNAKKSITHPVSEVEYGRGFGMVVTKRYSWDDLAEGELQDREALLAMEIMHRNSNMFSRLWKVVKEAAFGLFKTEDDADEEDAKISVFVDPSLEPKVRQRGIWGIHLVDKDRMLEFQHDGEPQAETMARVIGMAEMWDMRHEGGGFFGIKNKKPGDSGFGDLGLGNLLA